MSSQTHPRSEKCLVLLWLGLMLTMLGFGGCSLRMKTMTAELEEAFRLEPIPPPRVIAVPFEGDSDRAALEAALRGKLWQNVTCEYLRSNYPGPLDEAYTYLTVEGRAYFFPAFAKICLTNPKEADVLPQAMLNGILRQDTDSLKLVNALSPRQRRCMFRFFEDQFGAEEIYSQNLATARQILLKAE